MAAQKPITVADVVEALKALPQNLQLICASDDEGNSYRRVWFLPGIRRVNADLQPLQDPDELTEAERRRLTEEELEEMEADWEAGEDVVQLA